jgi:hypothetical protein
MTTEEVSIDEINGRLEFLTAQRNAAQNENAILAGRLHAASQTIERLSATEFEEVDDGDDESAE